MEEQFRSEGEKKERSVGKKAKKLFGANKAGMKELSQKMSVGR